MKSKPKDISLLVFAVILVIVVVFPIYVMVLGSFKPLTEIFSMELIPNPAILTLENYREVLEGERFGIYIGNTFFVAGIVTVVALIFHAMCAYSLARLNFPGKKICFSWIISTMMVPFSVIMVPLFIIVNKMGLINNLWGVIIPMIPNAYGIFLYRQFFLGIPRELEESARIDGASHFTTFLRIVLPLAKSITVTLAVAFFLANWNNYLWPMIVAQDREIWLLQVAIASFKSEKSVAWNLVLAASCIATVPTMLLFFVFQRYIADGIKTSGLKD